MSTSLTASPANPGAVQRLLVLRLGSMGDIIHTLPAVTALRQAMPEAEIGWVIEERWAELLCTLPTARSGPRSRQRPLVDRVHAVNTAKWRKELLDFPAWLEIAAAVSELRAPRYEVAADFQGAVRSALIARRSRAEVIYGPSQAWESVASMFYTRPVQVEGTHIVERNLSLASAIAGRKLAPVPIEFPHDAAAEAACDAWLTAQGIDSFALLNPGAGWGAKQWPAERYGQVAQELARQGLRPLVNFGPGEELLAQSVEAASGGAARAISSTLSQLIAYTRRAKLFVGGDTGPLHLAAALHVPAVAIFGPTNPARNGPFGNRSVVLRSPDSVTSHRRRAQPDDALLQITVEQVVDAIHTLLRSESA